jgi:hypothetical protein
MLVRKSGEGARDWSIAKYSISSIKSRESLQSFAEFDTVSP